MQNLRPILASHHDAVKIGLGRAPRERNIPSDWPGTYVPNFSDWREGDIVLVHGTQTSGAMIRAGHHFSWKSSLIAGRDWSHAAIYVGDGEVVDCCLGVGVQKQSVWNYCQNRAITRRRLVDLSIPLNHIMDIANIARTKINSSYSVIEPLLAKLGWPPAQSPNGEALYCSTFVSLVIAEATGIQLNSDPIYQPPYPGVFATHSDLRIELSAWRNI